MTDLEALEQRRNQILEAIGRIGDMRRGSVSKQYFQSAVKGAKQARGRGPYYVFTRKLKGKTRSRRVKGAEMERLSREVDNFHRYQELSRELIEVSEHICALRPVFKAGTSVKGVKKNSRSRSS